MGIKDSSAKRDLAGFLIGGVVGSVSSAAVFRAFYPPLPPDSQFPDHTGRGDAGAHDWPLLLWWLRWEERYKHQLLVGLAAIRDRVLRLCGPMLPL